ncbi:TetR/AcrR family transcriptional regulator [Glaciimonas immobilis]|uniref:AcrR family transcriptional regulator n=1 Tax=Glaciimonas immobilis TaxID=728004 RepID=A0A840RZQ5_9BURK|nr:TetR/AcrR family transcriptional regulator [Glaciimonas immobilis]KAF3998274.1 TetR/AcrR family transcriptional regulator [Glaciimonas immobilis]MBB5201890.1 AcrR family transcriptional regulator [Glaciimonas immobilis]
MDQKVPRRTREKILDLSLRLFNEFGEPNITTTIIADEMKISPGNLYYHFRNKDDIVNSIFATFEEEMSRMLTVPPGSKPSMYNVWSYLHLMFELIWRYRFFYRDLSDLLSRNRILELHFKKIFGHKINVVKEMCVGLHADKTLAVTPFEIETLSTNMVVTASYWLSYQYVLNPRKYTEEALVEKALNSGCYQVLSLMQPYLRGETLKHFEELTIKYLKKNGDNVFPVPKTAPL